MIYALIGTHGATREKALAALSKFGLPSIHIYSEQISAIEPLIEATSLFGDKVIAQVIQTMERAETREYVYDLLPGMKESDNIFIIDEPFADVHRTKKLEKYAEHVYDAREEKEKETSPFTLVNAIARRDKKNAWAEWMKLNMVLEPEAIHGALWWKWSTVWGDVLAGRPAKFTLLECEQIGGRILRSAILAHRGQKDLKIELESIILSL